MNPIEAEFWICFVKGSFPPPKTAKIDWLPLLYTGAIGFILFCQGHVKWVCFSASQRFGVITPEIDRNLPVTFHMSRTILKPDTLFRSSGGSTCHPADFAVNTAVYDCNSLLYVSEMRCLWRSSRNMTNTVLFTHYSCLHRQLRTCPRRRLSLLVSRMYCVPECRSFLVVALAFIAWVFISTRRPSRFWIRCPWLFQTRKCGRFGLPYVLLITQQKCLEALTSYHLFLPILLFSLHSCFYSKP